MSLLYFFVFSRRSTRWHSRASRRRMPPCARRCVGKLSRTRKPEHWDRPNARVLLAKAGHVEEDVRFRYQTLPVNPRDFATTNRRGRAAPGRAECAARRRRDAGSPLRLLRARPVSRGAPFFFAYAVVLVRVKKEGRKRFESRHFDTLTQKFVIQYTCSILSTEKHHNVRFCILLS